MSRSPARLKVTSLPPSKMRPEVGSSSPAIMRKVVVLPQPDGPSRTKNSPFSTTKLESLTAANSPKLFCRFSTRISAIALLRKLADDCEHEGTHQHDGEGPAIERDRERLHQHQDAERDQRDRDILHQAAAGPARPALLLHRLRLHAHFRTA